MAIIKLAVNDNGEWNEVGQFDADIIPRSGEILALDEPIAGANLPVGDFKVVQVKHYHFWKYPKQDEVMIFIDGPAA